LSRDRQLEH